MEGVVENIKETSGQRLMAELGEYFGKGGPRRLLYTELRDKKEPVRSRGNKGGGGVGNSPGRVLGRT